MTSLVLVVLGVTVFGPELEHCRLGTPMFVSETEGIVTDRCSGLFMTHNGGRSWSRGEAPYKAGDLGVVLADGSMLLAGRSEAPLLRSGDRGATWKRIGISPDFFIYDFSSRGSHVWASTGSDPLLHSGNFGKSWSVVETPAGDWTTLDFVDEKHGWIASRRGDLWKTDDGAVSWKPLTLPVDFTPIDPSAISIDRVRFVDQNLGFLFGQRLGTWRTRDGGATWEHLANNTSAVLVVRELPGGQRVLVTRDSADLPTSEWVVDLSTALLPRGPGAVSTTENDILLWSADGHQTIAGITDEPSAEVPDLKTMRIVAADLRTAIAKRRAYFSRDEGRSWRELPALPKNAVFRQVVMTDALNVVAKSGNDVFRLEGGHWQPSIESADTAALAAATSDNALDPLSCLSDASGRVAINLMTHGCFGGSTRTMDLAWSPEGGDINAAFDETPFRRHLTSAEVRSAIDELRSRSTRAELSSGCRSTTRTETSVTVMCTRNGRAVTQSLTFSTHECEARDDDGVGGAVLSWAGEQRAGYSRALGLREWALMYSR